MKTLSYVLEKMIYPDVLYYGLLFGVFTIAIYLYYRKSENMLFLYVLIYALIVWLQSNFLLMSSTNDTGTLYEIFLDLPSFKFRFLVLIIQLLIFASITIFMKLVTKRYTNKQ